MDKIDSAGAGGLRKVSLEDKWTDERGCVFISAKQALARVALLQSALDARNGLNTAGFITGYPGSPLGTFDLELGRIQNRLKKAGVVFQPGLNEDLAATAIWGSQQSSFLAGQRFDGVFAFWYGKGPGFDRACDAFKHANLAGTAEKGGALILVGDDHPGKSSGAAFQTDLSLAALGIPTLYPATVADFLRFGLYGIALSRYSGLYVAIKCVNECIDSAASVYFDLDEIRPVYPEAANAPGGVNIRRELLAVGEQDRRLVRYKLPRVGHFVHANGLDRVTIGQRQPGLLGIVTAGKAYLDVMGGLAKLRITPAVAEALGVSVLKLACVYPVSARTVLEFSHAAREVIVIEEKRPQIETQVAACLYNNPARPQLSGKHDPQGTPLIDADDPLTPLSVALAIGARLKSLGVPLPAQVIEALKGIETSAMGSSSPAGLVRLANYCAGCPHNTSTTPPEGGVVLTGVGCHSLVQFLDRTHVPVTQMGGEGANWLGIAPFASPGHAFANLGDGTYNHSGSLAIRAAVQANMTMTFRILLNDAIAMTGGQKIGPGLSPGQIIEQLLAEKVSAVFVASDEPGLVQVPRSNRVRVFDRIDLPAVYEDCRNTPGVSVLLYVQRCATEKRRDRKRGQLPQPSERIMINDLVCEGCGDCSVQSNCMAILPKETEFGRKRAIDQAACNVDQSCLRGFCPSFVTVEGQLRKPARELSEFETALAALPECAPAPMGESFGILAAGVGGSGVVTFGAVLAMAAHMEGLGSTTYDMTGLSQKGGAVFSHIRFLRRSDIDLPTRIGAQEADLLFGFDLVSAAQVEGLQSIAEGTTSVFCDRYVSPTAAFHKQRDLSFTPAPLLERLAGRKPKYLGDFDASDIARRTLGDPVFASMILLGLALQRGDVPLSGHAIEAAIKLNGAEVEANIRALRLGRLLCLEPHRLQNSHAGAPAAGDIHEALILRIKELADYQNSAYAARYREIVETALEADRRLGNDRQDLTWAVVRNAFKVMAYKDEYEVARLFTDGRFARQMAETFADGAKMSFHLAPPLLAQTDRVTGRPRKLRFGSWMRHGFQILSHLRWLRDTRFDPFGRAPERVLERRLRDAYLAWAGTLTSLQGHDYAAALKVARIPDDVRGFGPVKAAALTAALQQLEEAMMAATASSPAAVD